MFFYVSEMTDNYYACPGLQERTDATMLTISESQQHIEPSISHRSKRLKFVESSTGKLKLMDSPHRMRDLLNKGHYFHWKVAKFCFKMAKCCVLISILIMSLNCIFYLISTLYIHLFLSYSV